MARYCKKCKLAFLGDNCAGGHANFMFSKTIPDGVEVPTVANCAEQEVTPVKSAAKLAAPAGLGALIGAQAPKPGKLTAPAGLGAMLSGGAAGAGAVGGGGGGGVGVGPGLKAPAGLGAMLGSGGLKAPVGLGAMLGGATGKGKLGAPAGLGAMIDGGPQPVPKPLSAEDEELARHSLDHRASKDRARPVHSTPPSKKGMRLSARHSHRHSSAEEGVPPESNKDEPAPAPEPEPESEA